MERFVFFPRIMASLLVVAKAPVRTGLLYPLDVFEQKRRS